MFGIRRDGQAYHAEHSAESPLTVERAVLNAQQASKPAAEPGADPNGGS